MSGSAKLRLAVHVRLPDGREARAGELAVRLQPSGAIAGQFRYAAEWLDLPDAFSLDPVNLPLVPGIQDAGRPREGIHGVFEDALPDDWGQRLLLQRHRLSGYRARPPWLLEVVGWRALGALAFGGKRRGEERRVGLSRRLYSRALPVIEELEHGRFPEGAFAARIMEAGSSPGGARPKVVIPPSREDPAACPGYLLKFRLQRDPVSVVRLEAAALRCAADCGLRPVRARLDEDGRYLEVERFDVTPAGGRRHMVSLKTLLGAEHHYYRGYQDIARMLSSYSTEPSEDLRLLFRQMLFNALIGNRDDHLKNFLLLHDEAGWRLSPAFDLVPQLPLGQAGPHALRFLFDERRPKHQDLLAIGRSFGLSASSTRRLIREVLGGVDALPGHLEACRVPEDQAQDLLRGVVEYRNELARGLPSLPSGWDPTPSS